MSKSQMKEYMRGLPGDHGKIFDHGDTVPTDGTAGYSPGCLFLHTDAAGMSTSWYCNIGTNSSCNFDAYSVADAALGDDENITFGASSDLTIGWVGATSIMQVSPATDDTGSFNFGNGTKDIDVKVFLSTAAKYVLFDVGNVLLTLEDVDLHLGDNDAVEFGDAATGDVRVLWDSNSLNITPAVDDTGRIEIGDGATPLDLDVIWFAGAATKYLLLDRGNALVTCEDVDLKLGDNDGLQFGDAAGGDVSIKWDSNSLNILPAVDDTGVIEFGDGTTDMDVKIFLSAASKFVLFDVGNIQVQFDDVDLALGDNDVLKFGDEAAGDITFYWNNTNFYMTSAAAATPWLIGAAGFVFNTILHGSLTVGVDDTGYDVKLFGASASAYMLWDQAQDRLEFSGGADIVLEDNSGLLLGSAAAGDFAIYFSGSNVQIEPAVDDTGAVVFGNSAAGGFYADLKWLGGSATNYLLCDRGNQCVTVEDLPVTMTQGAAAAAVALRIGNTITEGLEIKVIDETVAIAAPAAASDLTEHVPAGAVILSVQANLQTAMTAAGGATKVGIGTAADPDKYGKTTGVTQNLKADTIPDWAVLAGAEDVQIYAVDNAGAAAGTIGGAGESVRVRIVYAVCNSLDNA